MRNKIIIATLVLGACAFFMFFGVRDILAMLSAHWFALICVGLLFLLTIKTYLDNKKEAKNGLNGESNSGKRTQELAEDTSTIIFDASSKPPFPLLGYLFTAFIAGLGLSFFCMMDEGYSRYKIQSTAKAWPTTMGVVEHSAVIDSHQWPGESYSQAKIIVRYVVGDVTYKINEAYIGQSKIWRDSRSAYREARRYRVGDQVNVHYSPNDPSLAAVETDFKLLTPAFYLFVILEAFALLSLYSSLEQHWRFIKSRRTY